MSYGFYIFGIIFPLTNIVGFTYYGHDGVWGNLSAGLGALAYYPFLAPSALCFLTSLSLFISSSAIYNFDFNNEINRGLLTGSAVCLGVSYLINLIVGIIYATMNYNPKYKKRFNVFKNIEINYCNNYCNIMCKIKI